MMALRTPIGLLALALALAVASPALAAPPEYAHPEYAPGQVLVEYREGVDVSARTAREHSRGASTRALGHGAGRAHLIKLPPGRSVADEVRRLRFDPDVLYAEPNYYRHALATPSDPLFPRQWPLHNDGQTITTLSGTSTGTPDADMDAPEAWDTTTCSSSVLVGIIDSGYDKQSYDLRGNIWTNPGETSCTDGVDNDANGYVDDCHGWDFVNNDNDPDDPAGHGTAVTALIGATGNDGYGLTGVCQQVSLVPLRFLKLDVYGGIIHITGTIADEVEAINYARAKGIRILNASIGSTDSSIFEYNAIKAFCDAGGLFVAAAGNEHRDNDTLPEYPASYPLPCVVSVAATTNQDTLAWFSNFGDRSVHVAAPGMDVYAPTLTAAPVFFEGFDAPGLPPGWVAGGTALWDASAGALDDSPLGSYAPGTDAWVNSPAVDLSGRSACALNYWFTRSLDLSADALYVQASADGATWTTADIITGSGPWQGGRVSLAAYEGGPAQFRFRLIADASVEADGVRVDEVSVRCGSEYAYQSGTSYAAPHAAGVLAMIASAHPSMTPAQMKGQLMYTSDSLVSLASAVITKGRINARAALIPLPGGPLVINATTSPTGTITLDWADDSLVETSYVIDRRRETDNYFTQLAALPPDSVFYNDVALVSGYRYHYRVHAVTPAGRSADSAEASALALTTGSLTSLDSGWCFIATAAYGSYLDPHVASLRSFRDRVLMQSAPGRALVGLYYRISPPLADLIAQRPAARAVARAALTPVVAAVEHPLLAGSGAGLFAALCGLAYASRRRHFYHSKGDR